ncbi:hypothetical protein [Methylocapsa aurea]
MAIVDGMAIVAIVDGIRIYTDEEDGSLSADAQIRNMTSRAPCV